MLSSPADGRGAIGVSPNLNAGGAVLLLTNNGSTDPIIPAVVRSNVSFDVPDPLPPVAFATVAIILTVITVATIVGNIFVILAIILERDLRRPQYYLILSLGIADVMVGLMVTPLSTVYVLEQKWTMGVGLCDFFISVDVLACTSSILHLVAIGLDRYWAITDVAYMQNRTPKRVLLMLGVVWTVSFIISIAPIFGWKDEAFKSRVNDEKKCLISQEVSYTVFSTGAAFYIPLCAIVGVYYRIFKAAKKRFKRDRQRKTSQRSRAASLHTNTAVSTTNTSTVQTRLLKPPALVSAEVYELRSEVSVCSENDSGPNEMDNLNDGEQQNGGSKSSTVVKETRLSVDSAAKSRSTASSGSGRARFRLKRQKYRETAESKRERKAWRTLAIITGTFVACWLPFFVLAAMRPFCECTIPLHVENLVTWLGYVNSAINPIIYTIFSPDFRLAFKKIVERICFWHAV